MDKRAMLAEVIALTAPPQLEEDEFTAYDYMDGCQESGLPRPTLNTAHRWLKQWATSYRKVLHKGRWTTAYRLVKDERQGHGG